MWYGERGDAPDEPIDAVYYVLTHPEARREMVEHNFAISSREFGFGRLRERLDTMFSSYADEIRASRKRLSKSMVRYSV